MIPALPDYTMLEQVILGLVLVSSFFVHEVGHVLGFRLYGIKTWFKPTWYGAVAGDKYSMLGFNPAQLIVVTALGPVVGILFLLPFAAWYPLWFLVAFQLVIGIGDILMILAQAYAGFKYSWRIPAVYIIGQAMWDKSIKKRGGNR